MKFATKLALPLVLLALPLTLPLPSWAKTATPAAPTVYAAGYCVNLQNKWVPGFWKNRVWNELPRLGKDKRGEATCIALSGADVYVGGWLASNVTDGTPVILGGEPDTKIPGYWKNGKWNPLPLLAKNGVAAVKTILVSGKNIYVGGFCTDKKGNKVAGYWKDKVWSALPAPQSLRTGYWKLSTAEKWGGVWTQYPVEVETASEDLGDTAGLEESGAPKDKVEIWDTEVCGLAVTKSGIIAIGIAKDPGFSMGGAKSMPCLWENGVWIGGMPPKEIAQVSAIAVSGADIYATGTIFDKWESRGIPGFWKNGRWEELPLSVTEYTYSIVNGVAVTGSDVYFGGSQGEQNGYWKDGGWTEIPSPEDAAEMVCIAALGKDVAVGGTIKSTIEKPAYWLSGSWVILPVLDPSRIGKVEAIALSKN